MDFDLVMFSMFQVSIPVELPTQLTLKPELSKTTAFSPPSTTAKASSALQTVAVPPKPLLAISPKAAESPGDDIDEELDQLLSLQKPVSALGNQFQDTLDEEQCESEKGEWTKTAAQNTCSLNSQN